MPIYEYVCSDCGPFIEMRPMAEYQAPQPCPTCDATSGRAILSVPNLAMMSSSSRKAHAVNERSADKPRVSGEGGSGHVHGPNCGCGSRSQSAANSQRGAQPVAKGFVGKRPWMISH